MRISITALLFTCFMLAFTATTWAQSNSKFTGSLLWKVSGKDITKPSYILGTHHFTDTAFLKKINGFENAFNECNRIVGELDLKDKLALVQQVQESIMIEPGAKGYKDILSEEEYEKLNQDLLNHIAIPLEAFLGVKPVMLSTLLAAKLYSNMNPSFNPIAHISIDEHIQILGTEKGKTTKGLEHAQDQIEALFSDPIEDQLRELICSLNEINLGEKATVLLDEYYVTGNLDALYKLAFDIDSEIQESACPMTEEKKSKILDNRNEHWLKQLPQLLKDNSNFIAVGALHLGGEEGLLYQLDKMGYIVEAIK